MKRSAGEDSKQASPEENAQCREGREKAHSAVPPTSQGTTRNDSARLMPMLRQSPNKPPMWHSPPRCPWQVMWHTPLGLFEVSVYS